jgi:lysophospholipase L1-like esterase
VVQRGTNDVYWSGITGNPLSLGNPDSTNEQETYGAIRAAIDYFFSNCPGIPIVFGNLMYNRQSEKARMISYNTHLESLLNEYEQDVYLCDVWNTSGINESNYEQYLMNDLIHPNSSGKELLRQCFAAYLIALLEE